MADKKKDGIVEYTVDGKTHWASEDSIAYQKHLASSSKAKPASKPAESTTKTPDAKS